jgi:hypothetical protein
MKKTQTNTLFMGCAGIMRGVGVLCLMGVSISAHALTWEKSTVDLTLDAGSPDVVVEFPFKNEGTETVTFKEIKASCGCTRAETDSQSIPPGGKGVIKATYAVGDRTGPQAVQVVVSTSEAGSALKILRLNLTIQPPVSMTTRLVQWTKADGLIPRTIQIKQADSNTVSKLEAIPPVEEMTVELKPATEPGQWTLTLTPKSVDQPLTAKIEIRATIGTHTTSHWVYGLVR